MNRITSETINNTVKHLSIILKDIEIGEQMITLKGSEKQVAYFAGNEQYPSDLIDKLSDVLYHNYYCQGTNPTEIPIVNPSENHLKEVKAFTHKLSLANTSKLGFNRYWKVIHKNYTGEVLLYKNGFKQIVSAGNYVNENHLYAPSNQNYVSLLQYKESAKLNNSFYFVFGDILEESPSTFMVRFYFNLKSEGAAWLTKKITHVFNQHQIPFQFKCLNHPAYYNRADAAVLYLSKYYANIGHDLLKSFINPLKKHLKASVPLFTYSIEGGIGFAENPLNPKLSFGQSRTKIIADGLAKAHLDRLPKSEWLAQVEAALIEKNLNPNQLYFNPNPNYPYAFIS